MRAYEVKNVKSFRGTEGHGFNATLYRYGKKVALVYDMADGGPINYDWVSKEEEVAFDSYLSSTPKDDSVVMLFEERKKQEGNEWMSDLDITGDIYVSNLVDLFESLKWLKRNCRGKILFRTTEDDEGSYRTIPVPDGKLLNALVHIRQKYEHNIVEVAYWEGTGADKEFKHHDRSDWYSA